MYKYLTQKDLDEGKEIAEILEMLNEDEKKEFLISARILRNLVILRKEKEPA